MEWDEESRPLRAAEREALAAEQLAALLAAGEELHPVVNRTRSLARHFWGKAWMRQLALCESGGFALAPGRTLLRHGCVLDVRLAPGLITAKVSDPRVVELRLHLAPLDEERVAQLRRHCAGRITSLVSLLEGKLDDALLTALCDPEEGLLPQPADWRMECSCADWSEPCLHAAAVIYAAGCLIDEEPTWLFTLRGIEPATLLSAQPHAPADAADFDKDGLGAMFGIELDLN